MDTEGEEKVGIIERVALVPCDALEGLRWEEWGRAQEGGDICIVDSHCCTAETNTTL